MKKKKKKKSEGEQTNCTCCCWILAESARESRETGLKGVIFSSFPFTGISGSASKVNRAVERRAVLQEGMNREKTHLHFECKSIPLVAEDRLSVRANQRTRGDHQTSTQVHHWTYASKLVAISRSDESAECSACSSQQS
jgi:hypothetical protein